MFLFKRGWSLLIRRFSINVILKSLLLLARIEKSSESGVWLQNKRCSLMVEWSSPLTLFPVSAKIPKCSHLASLVECLSIRLRNKWLRVRISLLWLKSYSVFSLLWVFSTRHVATSFKKDILKEVCSLHYIYSKSIMRESSTRRCSLKKFS